MHNVDLVRALNDAARRSFSQCRILVTTGVKSLNCLEDVLQAVRQFENFSEDNDPNGEHDFGCFAVSGKRLFWKFDYYDADMQMASLDPSDDTITVRVLTIMLADEY